jgi:hypothetical protein
MAPPDGSNGAVARSLGLLTLELGEPEAAERHLRAGIEIDERMGARPALASGQLALAAVLETRAQPRACPEAAELRTGAGALSAEFAFTGEPAGPRR